MKTFKWWFLWGCGASLLFILGLFILYGYFNVLKFSHYQFSYHYTLTPQDMGNLGRALKQYDMKTTGMDKVNAEVNEFVFGQAGVLTLENKLFLIAGQPVAVYEGEQALKVHTIARKRTINLVPLLVGFNVVYLGLLAAFAAITGKRLLGRYVAKA